LLDPAAEYSAGQYGLDARQVIAAIEQKGRLPIMVGGSGLYVKAVIDGLGNIPAAKLEIREELEEEHRRLGLPHLIEELRLVDAPTLDGMKQVNARRVIRALEVYRSSGIPLSRLHAEEEMKTASLDVFQAGLRWNRTDLHDRINARVDDMLRDGLLEETRRLLADGYPRSLNSLNTVGYKEICDYFEGKLTQESMIEAVKRNTRRFAKRQMTWFRADERIHWFDLHPGDTPDEIAQVIGHAFRKRTGDGT
jgi:tRNA dimethylallyltransferase